MLSIVKESLGVGCHILIDTPYKWWHILNVTQDMYLHREMICSILTKGNIVIISSLQSISNKLVRIYDSILCSKCLICESGVFVCIQCSGWWWPAVYRPYWSPAKPWSFLPPPSINPILSVVFQYYYNKTLVINCL